MSTRSAPDNLKQSDKDRLREESFQAWLLSKRQQKVKKREEDEKIKKMAAEEEQMRKETAELSYLLWKHKKDQERKAKEVSERKAKEEQERQKRLQRQVSKEQVSQWFSTARFRPRPVKSSMGLLSLCSNPPSFFNPHPWVDPS